MTVKVKELNRIEKLYDLNKLLTKSIDIGFILQTLVASAQELIGKSDTIILSLYNEKKNVLQIVEGIGIDMRYMKHMEIAPGESLTGKTFSTRSTMSFSRKEDINKLLNTLSEKNYGYYIKGVYGRHLRRSFCVPLLYKENCLGVLIVNNYENDNNFTEEEMMIIKAIANQSAVAIANAELVEHLREKNTMLSMSTDIHERFTKLVLEGGDKNRILLMLGRYLKCKVVSKDTAIPEKEFSSFPIIGNNEALGYIHYQKKEHEIPILGHIALGHAATALALNFLKENYLYEKELHLRELYFKEITESISSAKLEKVAKRLYWKSEWKYNCIVIEGGTRSLWDSEKIMEKRKFVESIEHICKSAGSESFVFIKGLQLILILPNYNINKCQNILNLIKEKWIDKTLLFGVGRETKINDIEQSFNEAKEAVQSSRIKGEQIIFYSELGAERLWKKVDAFTLSTFVEDQLGDLFTMEKEYQDTLFKLIELNKNRKETAKSLHIHTNTLYHRLRRIENVLNISLDNINDWLNVNLAYQIHCLH